MKLLARVCSLSLSLRLPVFQTDSILRECAIHLSSDNVCDDTFLSNAHQLSVELVDPVVLE